MRASELLMTRLGLRYPIIQAPMAGVSTPQLVAVVSEAGGLGSLGIGASTVVDAQQAIEETRRLTVQPFNVNVFCHRPARRDPAREAAWLRHLAPLFREAGIQPPEVLEEIYTSFLADDEAFGLLLRQRPAVVSFHFGLPPRERIRALREAGIFTLATATSLYEAQCIEEAGVDAIIAQGVEAGGHRGVFNPDGVDECLGTQVLVRLLVQQTTLPVIAAGGIMDGQGIRAALDLGAAAAQLGTAFILCPESAANAACRSALKGARATHTRLTRAISGRPARGLPNRLIAHGEADGAPPPADYPVAYDAAKRLNAAATKLGSDEFAAQWAGQGAPLARELPAAQLIASLAGELAG